MFDNLLYTIRAKVERIKNFAFDAFDAGFDKGVWGTTQKQAEKPGAYIKSFHVTNVTLAPKREDTIYNTDGLDPWKMITNAGSSPHIWVGSDWVSGEYIVKVSKDAGKIVDAVVLYNGKHRNFSWDSEKVVVHDGAKPDIGGDWVQVRIECECHKGTGEYFDSTFIVYPNENPY